MQLYRHPQARVGWTTPEELEAAAGRSTRKWATSGAPASAGSASYVLQEEDGTLGTYCIYEAESPEAIRAHAEDAGFRR